MLAQSQASVPPAPAWISRKALHGSASWLNMRRNSRSSMVLTNDLVSVSIVAKPSSSPSALLISKSSVLSASSCVRRVSVTTTPSSNFFSRPSSWAFFGSSQTLGSSREALTVLKRSDLASKSKIPPKFDGTNCEVGQSGANEVDAFCFHGALLYVTGKTRDFLTRAASVT